MRVAASPGEELKGVVDAIELGTPIKTISNWVGSVWHRVSRDCRLYSVGESAFNAAVFDMQFLEQLTDERRLRLHGRWRRVRRPALQGRRGGGMTNKGRRLLHVHRHSRRRLRFTVAVSSHRIRRTRGGRYALRRRR